MEKKSMHIIFGLLLCITTSTIFSSEPSKDEIALRKIGGYILHGTAFVTGMRILQHCFNGAGIKRLLGIPFAYFCIKNGYEPFVPGNNYFELMENGKIKNPFSISGAYADGKQSLETAQGVVTNLKTFIEKNLPEQTNSNNDKNNK